MLHTLSEICINTIVEMMNFLKLHCYISGQEGSLYKDFPRVSCFNLRVLGKTKSRVPCS